MIRKLRKSLRCSARFGPFRFDTKKGVLTNKGNKVALGGQPLLILQMFLDKPGVLVTRKELHQALWPNLSGVDTTRRLNTAIRALRKSLGDCHENPSYIETVRSVGYRWIGTPSQLTGARTKVIALAAVLCLVIVGWQLDATRSSNHGLGPDQDYSGAQLKAESAVKVWRMQPTEPNFTSAWESVQGAIGDSGENAGLNALAGELMLYGRWDREAAEAYFERALVINPDFHKARKDLAWLYTLAGNDAKAWQQLDQLVDKLNLTDAIRAEYGWMFLKLGRPDLSLLLCDSPAVVRAHFNLLVCRHTALARSGSFEAARHVALKIMETQAAGPELMGQVANTTPHDGYQIFLDWQAAAPVVGKNDWFLRAQLQAQAGDLQSAKISLTNALARRDPLLIKLRTTPEFDALSDWRGYLEILKVSEGKRETGG